MTSDDPWSGLDIGGRDAFRVDRSGRHDFFWWLSEKAEPSLMLILPKDIGEIEPPPTIRQLDLRYSHTSGGQAFTVRLRDREQKDLFLTLCRDLVAAGEAVETPQDALKRVLMRTRRWHHLLRGGSAERLGKEEQRGLVAELDMLRQLVVRRGARAAIEAWTGPEGSAKDFELGPLCVEVKARRLAALPHVMISSEHQLADVAGARLILRVADIDAVVKPAGMTLTDHVEIVDDLFARADLESYGMWEAALAATGYSHDHDYSGLRWTVGTIRHFEVVEGFPRVTPPLAEGVGNIRYTVSLGACGRFEMSGETFERLIEEQRDE